MKIYYISDSELYDWSAHTVHINSVCKNLEELGNDITLYVPGKSVVKNVKYNLIRIPAPYFLRTIIYQPLLFLRLLRDIAVKRPDILYSRHSQFLFAPALLSRFYSIPLVLEVNGRLVDETIFDSSVTAHIFRYLHLYKLIESFNLSSAKCIITTTEGLRTYISSSYAINKDKITAISSGVDLDLFKPEIVSRKALGLYDTYKYIGYIGSLKGWQGLKEIVLSAKFTINPKDKVKFLIVGDGEERQVLESLIAKENLGNIVELRNAIPHNLVPEYINALDICVSYPTKFRAGATSPFKIYEYLACGKPVVSSDILGMREEFGESVIYAEPESPENLANVFIELLADKKKLDQLCKNGRQFVEQKSGWGAVALKTIEVFNEALKIN